MCQLLGMNCAAPTDFSFSLKGFCQRGGATDIHSHGFGLAIYEGRGLRCFHDTKPASESPIAQLIQNYPIRTYNMVAHVRYATTGAVSSENVHPFSRELWGIQWTFAHNGQVPKFDDSTALEDQPFLGRTMSVNDLHYNPIGDTDSEAVFCAILNALKAEFHQLPTLPILHDFLTKICQEIIRGDEESTIFNFLLGCGQFTMFAYSWPGRRPGSSVWNGLYYLIRQPPFSTASLIDVDYSVDFADLTTPSDRIAVITTKPLTNEEGWTEFQRGQLIMFDKGLPYDSSSCCEFVEREGRGLYSKCFQKRHSKCPSSTTTCATATKASSSSSSLQEIIDDHHPSSAYGVPNHQLSTSPPTKYSSSDVELMHSRRQQELQRKRSTSISIPPYSSSSENTTTTTTTIPSREHIGSNNSNSGSSSSSSSSATTGTSLPDDGDDHDDVGTVSVHSEGHHRCCPSSPKSTLQPLL